MVKPIKRAPQKIAVVPMEILLDSDDIKLIIDGATLEFAYQPPAAHILVKARVSKVIT